MGETSDREGVGCMSFVSYCLIRPALDALDAVSEHRNTPPHSGNFGHFGRAMSRNRAAKRSGTNQAGARRVQA